MAEKIAESVKDEAFLLRSTVYGDDHRILSLLTSRSGRVDVIALGAKKSLRRFPALDFLHCLAVEYKASRRGGLHQLVHSELAEDFAVLQRDYESTILALRWLRLISQVLPEGQHVAGIFPLLRGALRRLRAATREGTNLEFLRELLSRLGFHLELSRCLRCGSEAFGEYYFSAEAGGLLCPSCHGNSERARAQRTSLGAWNGSEALTEIQAISSRRILAEAFERYLGAEI